jgi:hypothetical protein
MRVCMHAVQCMFAVQCMYALKCKHTMQCMHTLQCMHSMQCMHTVQCMHNNKAASLKIWTLSFPTQFPNWRTKLDFLRRFPCSTVVELWTYNQKIEGLNPDPATGRENGENKLHLSMPQTI